MHWCHGRILSSCNLWKQGWHVKWPYLKLWNISISSAKVTPQCLQVLPLFSLGIILTMITLILLKVINFETSFAKLEFFPSLSLVAMIMSFQTRFTTHIIILKVFLCDQKLNVFPNSDTWHNDHIANYAYSQSDDTKSRTTYKSLISNSSSHSAHIYKSGTTLIKILCGQLMFSYVP